MQSRQHNLMIDFAPACLEVFLGEAMQETPTKRKKVRADSKVGEDDDY